MSEKPVRTHSGDGRLAENIVVYVLCLLSLFIAFYLFSIWRPEDQAFLFGTVEVPGWLTFTGAVLFYGLTWMIPFSLLSSKTAKRSEGGLELTQK